MRGEDRQVLIYQSQIIARKDDFVYHNIVNRCHSSAWLSTMQGFIRLHESQAKKLGGRLCQGCRRKLRRR